MNPPSPRTALAVAVGVLAVYGVTRSTVVPGDIHLATNTAMIGGMAVLAAWAGLGRDELGLAPSRLWVGARLGLLVVVAVAGGTAIAALIAPSEWFPADATGRNAGDVWRQALVAIPIGTVMLEELAFRGVVLALCRRSFAARAAIVVHAVLFGLWHVPGAAGGSVPALIGVVAATTVAGFGFQWLRDRADSLAAPALAHWATNGVTLLVVHWLAG